MSKNLENVLSVDELDELLDEEFTTEDEVVEEVEDEVVEEVEEKTEKTNEDEVDEEVVSGDEEFSGASEEAPRWATTRGCS